MEATQAKGTRGKSEVRFRATTDTKLFAILTAEQVRALEDIHLGHEIAISDLPRAEMRYDNSPRCIGHAASLRLLGIKRNYEKWRTALSRTKAYDAVMAYIETSAGIRAIERECRIRNGYGYGYIQTGLQKYVNMMGWCAKSNDNAQMRMMGEKPTHMPSILQ